MTKIQGLIFDLDGVIVDTAKYHYVAWKSLADKLNIHFDHEMNEQLKGVSRVESLDKILDWGKMDLALHEKEMLMNEKNNHYVSLVENMTPEEILPGVTSFLEKAKRAGLKLSIGSSSKNAVKIIEQIELRSYFDAVIDGNKVKKSKPDPEVFIKASEALHLASENCIVFEDAIAGIDAARAAGMKNIGIGLPEVLNRADKVILGFEGVGLDILDFN